MPRMTKLSLRTASICCLALWLAIWVMFLLMRLSPFDLRGIPDIGLIMPLALAVALLASIIATLLAGAALIRQPRVLLNLMAFGCAIAALFGQMLLFLISSWL